MGTDMILQVWIVDDDPDDTSFYVTALRDLGYQGLYTCFNDAQEALKQLERPNAPLPALLIIDYYMPKMTGIEMVESLRKSNFLRKLEVVLMSGSVNQTLRDYASFAGIRVFEKADTRKELLQLFSGLDLIEKA